MKIKLPILIAVFCVLTINSNAQYHDYDLSDYKLPEIKTDRLDLNLFFDQAHSSNSTHSSFLASDPFQKSNNWGGMIDINYYSFRNSSKYQGAQQVRIMLEPNNIYIRTTNDTLKRKTLRGQISYNSYNRFYNRSNIFLEIDPNAVYNTRINRFTNSGYEGVGTDGDIQSSVSVPVSIGFGRIEPVEDARLAIYIIEELTKSGRITASPNDSIITEFASEISRIKRKRFFDSRIKKIEELKAIDSFLVRNNLVTTGDIVYFTALNDQWDFAAGPARNSGFSVNAGFNNSISREKNIESVAIYVPATLSYAYEKTTLTSDVYTAGLLFRIDYSRPLNLYWQSDLSFISTLNKEFTRNPSDKEDIESNFDTNVLNTTVNYVLRFLPDSRTSISLSVGGRYRNLAGNRDRSDISGPISGRLKAEELIFDSSIDLYYYFSPQLRIQLGFNLNSLKTDSAIDYESVFTDETSEEKYFSNNFIAGFVYSFF